MNKIIISILLLAGTFFMLVSAIGILKFKDLYSRLHAGAKATSFALLLIVLGSSLFFNTAVVYLKGVLIIIFIYLTAPLAAHTIFKSFQNPSEKKDDSTSKK
jgi:multicomponent Na+:H+ antiporter subunit G